MYQIQEDKLSYFEKEIDNPNRKITYKFTLNDEPLEANQIMDNPTLITDAGLDHYGVGCALVTQLQMSVKSDVAIKPKDEIAIEIGLDIYNEVTEKWETLYTSLGVFYVDALEEKGMKKSIKAYDGMYKLQNGYFPTAQHTTTQAIANDIATANGYKVKGISNVTINNEQLEGKTCLEMLSLVASSTGSHVRISRDGSTIEFVTPANYGSVFTESDYSTPTIDDATQYNITKLRVNYSDQVTDEEGEVTDEGYFEVGEGTDAQTLAISNPLLKGKKSQAQAILTKIKAMNGYKRFDANLPLGDFRLDTMDTVSYFYKDKMYTVPILYMKMVLSYGGISIETQSPTVAETRTEFSFKGTLSQKVENIYTDIIQVKQLTAGKVSTDELEATVATIEKLYAQKAEIEELYATKAEIGDLVAGSIAVEDLKTQIAEIDKAVINKADITELNAVNATINSLKANVAEIDDLLANSIISQIIQSGSVSSDLLNVKDGFIKDAMIDSLNASKINSGVINTNNVTITSSNGNMTLQGNLLQFKDKNGKVRIQIGQDTTGNYTFTIYDETGTGVLINEKGIQSSNAIKDGLIVDIKVASNANISGSKLNISSVYDEMNKDGSKTLKASKVLLDDQKQTLDVSFKEMTTKQEDIEESMSTAITDISVAQGQIKTLIQDTQITSGGTTTKLKDAYSKLEQNVNGISASVGKVESTVNTHTGEISSVKSDVSTIKADLNEINLGISSVEQKVDGIQVGGRNLLIIKTKKGNTYIEHSTGKDTSSSAGHSASDYIQIDGAKNFTLSYNGTKSGDCRIVFYNSDKTLNIGYAKNKAGSFEWTTTVPNNAYYVRVSVPDYDKMKFEKGTKATDYTPAPEDINSSIQSVSDSLASFETTVNGTFKDGIVQQAEAKAIEQNINILNNEKADIDKEYTSIYNNSNLSGTAKTNLNSAYTSYNSAHTSLISTINTAIADGKTTSTEKASVDSTFTTYKGVLATYKQRVQEALDYISSYKVDSVQVGSRNLWIINNLVSGNISSTTVDGSIVSSDALHKTMSTLTELNGSKSVTIQLWNPNKVTNESNTNRIAFFDSNKKFIKITGNTIKPDGNVYKKQTFDVPSNASYMRIGMICGATSYDESIKIKVELGNKPTDYTPAPEDVDTAITNAETSAVTTSNKYTDSQISITKESIELGVSQTYETKTNVSSQISSTLTSAKSYADTKKAEAITSANNALNTTIANYYTKTQTDSAIKVAKDSVTTQVSKVEQIASGSGGRMLYTDPTFATGSNSTKVYNNSGNGNVTVTRIAKSSDCPTTSGYMLEIKTIGTASPSHGGFYFANASRANAVFITKILAKIPTGCKINWATNAVGTGSKSEWLTSQDGTGTWQEYILKVTCGSTGTFSSTNFFYLTGGAVPITWHVAMATVYDLTATDNIESRLNSAEQKITTDTIVSTVTSSKTYTDAMTGKVNKSEIISSINQTAESVKINASKIELTGDVVINAINGSGSTSISGNKIKTGTIQGTNFIAGGNSADGVVEVRDASNKVQFYGSKEGVYATNIQFPDSISSSGAVTSNCITTASGGSGFVSSFTERGTTYDITYRASLNNGGLTVTESGNFDGSASTSTTSITGGAINCDGTLISGQYISTRNQIRFQADGGGTTSNLWSQSQNSVTGNGQMLTSLEGHIYVGNPSTNLTIEGKEIHVGNNSGVKLSNNSNGNRLNISSSYGTITIGSYNSEWSHFETDRAKFWFQKNVHVAGEIYAGSGYNQRVFHTGWTPSSGQWFNGGAVIVRSDGVSEVGRILDFHNTNSSTGDYDIRLEINAGGLACSGNLRSNGGYYMNGKNVIVPSSNGNGVDVGNTTSGIALHSSVNPVYWNGSSIYQIYTEAYKPTTTSDIRYKKAIGDVDIDDCYNMVKNIGVHSYLLYENKDEEVDVDTEFLRATTIDRHNRKLQMGVMAHELMDYACSDFILVRDEVLDIDGNVTGDKYSINDYNFSSAILGGLQKEIQIRDEQYEELKKENEELKNRLSNIERMLMQTLN